MNLIELLGLSCISVLWVVSEPTVYFRYKLFGDADTWYTRLLSCSMCSGFWIALVATQNIFHAAIVSICAELICQKINNYL
jgi:hypothetical protein